VIAIALLTIGTGLVGNGLARVSAGIDPQVGAETNTTTLRAPAR
jgi:hypothetical protein